MFNFGKSRSDDASDNNNKRKETVTLSAQTRNTKHEIDYVLVCNAAVLNLLTEHAYVYTFLKNLKQKGLNIEIEKGTVYDNLLFIKVHGPYDVLLRYADAFKLELTLALREFRLWSQPTFKFMSTDLTRPDPDGPIFKRALETLSWERPMRITSTERIMIVHALLTRTRFGSENFEYGIGKLLKRGTFVTAYPLHAGQWTWTETGPLNDRQLLAQYWARIRVWYKTQPVNVIEKYYGSEVAFYFAFYGFYNKMLLWACVIGLLCFFFGLLTTLEINKSVIDEVCNSNIQLCPVIFKNRTGKLQPLRQFCFWTKLTYAFDNYATILFAFFMSFWATIFMELWKRKHAVLIYCWNLRGEGVDTNLRTEFEENTKYRRVCTITGQLEPYNPKWIMCLNYGVTFVTCLFLVVIVATAVFISILYCLLMDSLLKERGLTLLSRISGAILSVIFIKIFGTFYSKTALWLTTKENPRTQAEFDDSYIYKLFLLSFVNNYAALCYVAFVKGRLYLYPGDVNTMIIVSAIRADLCPPAGCIIGLSIQLMFIMLFKSLAGNIFAFMVPIVKQLLKRCLTKNELSNSDLPQWEQDYKLLEVNRYFLVREYMEIIMQYGFVTFFAAAFPLAPLCAFINNMIEVRTDAYKFVRRYRRPVPIRIRGLLAWNGILQAMTFISTITNAFIIAFTSDFVKREIYKYDVDSSLKGYINSTLSVFSTHSRSTTNRTCFYRGSRYPPDHPHKYQLTSAYWFELCVRFIVAVIFEHVLLTLTGILAYAIPDMPYSIRKQIKYDRNKTKEERIRAAEALSTESE